MAQPPDPFPLPSAAYKPAPCGKNPLLHPQHPFPRLGNDKTEAMGPLRFSLRPKRRGRNFWKREGEAKGERGPPPARGPSWRRGAAGRHFVSPRARLPAAHPPHPALLSPPGAQHPPFRLPPPLPGASAAPHRHLGAPGPPPLPPSAAPRRDAASLSSEAPGPAPLPLAARCPDGTAGGARRRAAGAAFWGGRGEEGEAVS